MINLLRLALQNLIQKIYVNIVQISLKKQKNLYRSVKFCILKQIWNSSQKLIVNWYILKAIKCIYWGWILFNVIQLILAKNILENVIKNSESMLSIINVKCEKCVNTPFCSALNFDRSELMNEWWRKKGFYLNNSQHW